MPFFNVEVTADDVITEMGLDPQFQVELSMRILRAMGAGLFLDDFCDCVPKMQEIDLQLMYRSVSALKSSISDELKIVSET